MKDFIADKLYVSKLDYEDMKNMTLFNNQEFVYPFEQVNIGGCLKYALPRYFYDHPYVDDYRTEGEAIDISLKSKYKPLNDQQEQAIQSILNNDHGIVNGRVGFGKTYVAIDAICRLKKRALIIVNVSSADSLMDQWINSFVEYTNLKREDIGIIKTGIKTITEKPIYMTTIQTLYSRSNLEDKDFIFKMYEANFGITFFDECHITSSVFSPEKSFKNIFSKRVYGLSATPHRSDGLSLLVDWFIGPLIFEDTYDFVLPMYVGLVDIPIPLGRYEKWLSSSSNNGIFTRYSKFLMKSEQYIQQLVSIIDCCIEHGRNVLVLSAVIDMLKLIYEHSKFKDKLSLVYGAKKDKDYTKQAILATVGIFKAGMDVPKLDTIIYATPLTNKTSLIQSIGRVARVYKQNANKKILVIDITNSEYDLTNGLRKYRLSYYRQIRERSKFGLNLVNLNNIDELKKLLFIMNKSTIDDFKN